MSVIPSFSVSMDIFDILYVSYMLPETKLKRFVPSAFGLASFGNGMAFLSVVCFHSRDVRVAGLPFMKFSYDQINIRTYVKDPVSGKTGVLFLYSGIASRFVSISTNVLGFPWRHIRFQIHSTRNGSSYEEYKAHGNWLGNINISAKENHLTVAEKNLFDDSAKIIHHITSPQSGFYKTGGGVLRFEVKHTEIKPHICDLVYIDFPFIVSTGLLSQEEIGKPYIVLIAEKATFTAFLPPQRIR